jgi:hypothetical protein
MSNRSFLRYNEFKITSFPSAHAWGFFLFWERRDHCGIMRADNKT